MAFPKSIYVPMSLQFMFPKLSKGAFIWGGVYTRGGAYIRDVSWVTYLNGCIFVWGRRLINVKDIKKTIDQFSFVFLLKRTCAQLEISHIFSWKRHSPIIVISVDLHYEQISRAPISANFFRQKRSFLVEHIC